MGVGSGVGVRDLGVGAEKGLPSERSGGGVRPEEFERGEAMLEEEVRRGCGLVLGPLVAVYRSKGIFWRARPRSETLLPVDA